MARRSATPRAVMERKKARTEGRSALAQSCARVEVVCGMGGVCVLWDASTIGERFLVAPLVGMTAFKAGRGRSLLFRAGRLRWFRIFFAAKRGGRWPRRDARKRRQPAA